MSSFLQKLKSNEFLRNNLVFFIGSMCVAFLNYLYYPVLGRLLPVESFGEVQVLLSFLTQLSVILTAFGLLTTNIVVNEPNKQLANQLVTALSRVALYGSIIIFVGLIILSGPLQSALQFSSWIPFVLVGVSFIVGATLAYQGAFLRAKKDFTASSIQGVIGGLGKIIFSALLIIVGFQAAGAIGGFVVAQLVTLLYTAYRVKRLGFQKQATDTKRIDWSLIKPYLPYALFVFIITLVMTLFFSFDILLVKYLFSPEIAGQYSGVSTIARVVLFLTGSFSVVLLSSIKVEATTAENRAQLSKAALITIIMGGIAAVVFALFPTQVTHLLFGARYDGMAHVLPILSFTMLFISFATLLANFHIALRQYWVLVYIAIGVVTAAVLLLVQHGSVESIVWSFFYGSAVMLVALIIYTLLSLFFNPKQAKEAHD